MKPQLIRKEDLHTDHRRTVPSRPATMAESLGPPATRSFLTSTHWKLLSNVVHAFDTYTSVLHGLDDSLALVTPISTSLQSFIRSIADFRIMTSGEQSSLLQRNMQGPLTYYCLGGAAEFLHSRIQNSGHIAETRIPDTQTFPPHTTQARILSICSRIRSTTAEFWDIQSATRTHYELRHLHSYATEICREVYASGRTTHRIQTVQQNSGTYNLQQEHTTGSAIYILMQ